VSATATKATATGAGVIRAAQTIADLSARTLAAGQAHIDSHASGRIIRLAEEQSLRVVHAAQADLAQRAIERWIELLYDTEGGVWWNVREDGMTLKAPPWSRSRRRSYGLSEPQARLLRRIVGDLVAGLPVTRQLYYYLPQHQRWAINRSRFPTLDMALEWQRTLGAIRAATWHTYSVRYPGGRK
jgi:hypothetical protein